MSSQPINPMRPSERLVSREKRMKCVICKKGETSDGTTTLTLEPDKTVLVRGVPERACRNCGDAYVGETVRDQLLGIAEEAVRSGIQVDVRE